MYLKFAATNLPVRINGEALPLPVTVVDGLARTGDSWQGRGWSRRSDGSRAVSLRLSDGRYLRHTNGVIWAHPDDGSAIFRLDATFHCVCMGHAEGQLAGGMHFQSVNYPNAFIGLSGGQVCLVELLSEADRRMASLAVTPIDEVCTQAAYKKCNLNV